MDTGLIICTHKRTGVEIKNSVEMITGMGDNIEVIEFLEDNSPEEVSEKYQSAIEKLNTNKIIFLVDIKGGTPFNCAARMKIENPSYEVITGVNIPMVISFLMADENEDIEQIVKKSIKEAKDSIERLAF